MQGETPNLPELPICAVVWFISAAVSVASTIISSQHLRYDIRLLSYLETGWSVLNSHKDTTDLEWQDFKRSLFFDLKWWFLGSAIISLTMRQLFSLTEARNGYKLYKKVIFTIYGLVYSSCLLGLTCTSLMLIVVLSVYFVVKLVKSTKIMWIVSFAWIALVQWFLHSELIAADDYCKSLQFSSLAYTILRSIYFAKFIIATEGNVEHNSSGTYQDCYKCDLNATKKEQSIGIFDPLCYCFYVPFLTFGQLLVFEEFIEQINSNCPMTNHNLIRKAIRVVIWSLFYEVVSHFSYAFALSHEETLLWEIPLWSLLGSAYIITQMFTVKYVILWSFTSLVAGFDGLSTPPLPECTSSCYQASSIWRTFDNGLYEFIKRNIYIALGGSNNGLTKQLNACSCSFLFLCFWHGLSSSITLWCLTSYVSVILEMLVHFSFAKWDKELSMVFTENNLVRMKCLFLNVNLVIFLSGTLIFLGNTNLCLAAYYRVFVQGFPISTMIFLICTYCGLQTGRALSNCRRVKNTKKLSTS